MQHAGLAGEGRFTLAVGIGETQLHNAMRLLRSVRS